MQNKSIAGPILGLLTLVFSFIATASAVFQSWLAFWICLLLALVSLTVFARLRFADFINFFVSRQARYGANVALSIIGVIGIAVFANAIVGHRFDKRTDLTKLQLYTLSEQTKTVLKNLEKEIQVTAFFSNDIQQLAARAKDILELYQRETESLTVSFKDPYTDLQFREKYQIQYDGTIIFESQDQEEKVTVVEEQKFTSAILKLMRNETKKIYFLVGHEEHGLDDFNKNGYSDVRTELENQNYVASSLSLLTAPAIPTDCAVLVIAGPKTALTRHELDAVTKYLNHGGKLFLMLDPSDTAAEDANNGLVRLMKKWGITIGNDLVIDKVQFIFAFGPTAPVPGPVLHDITRALTDPVAFPVTRSVTPLADSPPNLSVKSLFKTASGAGNSWGETQRKADGTFSEDFTHFTYDPDIDTPSPVSVAIAAEQKIDQDSNKGAAHSPTRIVVFGDSDFAANAIFRAPNRDIFLATINWLTLEEDLIAIRPIDLRDQTLRQMLVQDQRLVQITSVFLIPTLVFTAGLIVWWQRREGERNA